MSRMFLSFLPCGRPHQLATGDVERLVYALLASHGIEATRPDGDRPLAGAPAVNARACLEEWLRASHEPSIGTHVTHMLEWRDDPALPATSPHTVHPAVRPAIEAVDELAAYEPPDLPDLEQLLTGLVALLSSQSSAVFALSGDVHALTDDDVAATRVRYAAELLTEKAGWQLLRALEAIEDARRRAVPTDEPATPAATGGQP